MAANRYSNMQDYITKFWPLLILLVIGLLFLSFSDRGSLSEMASSGALTSHSGAASPGRGIPHAVAIALVHYATSNITPQQTKNEVMVTANILQRRGPSNFLIFGLGFDSPLWHTLNHGGRTVFLEEDPSWLHQMSQAHPYLEAYHMNYTTVLSEANHLLDYARKSRDICSPAMDLAESECKLAIKTLPKQIYGMKWDVIMIDAPTGYYPGAPGRMSAIFSAAVMAMGPRHKEQLHVTDILLHDVDRPVERDFSKEFLCPRNLVESVGRLWHFEVIGGGGGAKDFCTDIVRAKTAA